jgi:hypothetical protein
VCPRSEDVNAKISRVRRYLKRKGKRRPENPRRGCSGRESGTPRFMVKTLECIPDVTR